MSRTRREITELARQARRHGYYAVGTLGLEGYVQCPECGHRVEGCLWITLWMNPSWRLSTALSTGRRVSTGYQQVVDNPGDNLVS